MIIKESKIKRFVGLHFLFGACNLKCSYCYVGQHNGKYKEIPYSMEQMKKAFSKERMGGVCLINICSDGETLIHPLMPEIIKMFLEEGHYVMVVTNGTLRQRIEETLSIDEKLLKGLFFKISFHYEEMVRSNMLDAFFDNVDLIKKSPASFTVEYITCDETLESIDELKKICMDRMGALPQLNMPRDSQRKNLGVLSKYEWTNYLEKWEDQKFESEFFAFRKQFFGKRYTDYCYAGERQIWVNMGTGWSRQCYHRPPLQDFMGELDKPVKWLAVGNHCVEAHCYVSYALMTLGIVPFPEYTTYKTNYAVIRNRKCKDGTEWIKPTFKKVFEMGIEEREHSPFKKKIVNALNDALRWQRRKEKNR